MILRLTHASTRSWVFLVITIFLVPAWGMAQPPDAVGPGQEVDPPVADATDSKPETDDSPETSTEPRVLCAYRYERSSADADQEPNPCNVQNAECPQDLQTVHLEDRLVVRVDHLAAWLENEDKDRTDLRLFLDGVELVGLEPEAVQAVEDNETWRDVRFRLTRDAENRESWRGLLGPFTFAELKMTVGLGFEDQDEIASSARICFLPVRTGGFVFFAFLLAIFLFVFLWAAKKSELLRDRHADATPKPYSLARCQMAWWFFLIIAAYGFLWLVLRDLDTITGSVVVLLGIGSGTALGASAIDSSKKTEEERVQAERKLAQVRLNTTGTSADEALLAAAKAKQQTVQGAVKRLHESFLKDIFSDKNGFSFHRFQIVAWTLVLGIIFAYSVYHDLAMPQFSEMLLGLMGISAGTYLGFKFPERFEPNDGNS